MKKRVIGIILIVLDVLAIFGGFANGSWAKLGEENIVTAATEIIIIIALLVIGIRLMIKSKDNKKDSSADENKIPNAENAANIIAGAEAKYAEKAKEKEMHSLQKDDLLKIFSEYFVPNKDFYSAPGSKKFEAYFNAVNSATAEIFKDTALLTAATGWKIDQLSEVLNEPNTSIKNMNICALIFLVGKYSVIKDAVYCVDFANRVPNCIALYLLLIAQKQPENKRKQLLDAGDGCDKRALIKAMQSLKVCDPSWSFEIF